MTTTTATTTRASGSSDNNNSGSNKTNNSNNNNSNLYHYNYNERCEFGAEHDTFGSRALSFSAAQNNHRVGHEGRGAEEVHAVVVEVICVVGWRDDCSRGSDGLIFGLGSKEDGMGKLDLLLRRDAAAGTAVKSHIRTPVSHEPNIFNHLAIRHLKHQVFYLFIF